MKQYFPGTVSEDQLRQWANLLDQTYKYCKLIINAGIEKQLDSKIQSNFAKAAQQLDFTRPYTVKVIGHGGAGKSTLLGAMLGRDIFPREFGKAITGVITRVRLCDSSDQENMHIEFLTRPEFEEMEHKIRARLSSPKDEDERKELQKEIEILKETKQRYASDYLNPTKPPKKDFKPDEWAAMSKDFVMETSQNVRGTRLVKYVEFVVYADKHHSLPSRSMLVDLPGGASLLYHEDILRSELDNIDAIILVVGSNRSADDARSREIFKTVNNKLTSERVPRLAASMILVARTYWDQAQATENGVPNAREGMKELLKEDYLPRNYANYHKHGLDEDFFFPIRALDALIAKLSLNQEPRLSERLPKDCTTYLHDMQFIAKTLRPQQRNGKMPSLSATDFQSITDEQHEAMLDFSGLPDLAKELQDFLTNNRYEVQLEEARTALNTVLLELRELCKEQLRQEDFSGRTLEEFEKEWQTFQSQREAIRDDQIKGRTDAMLRAWTEARLQFEKEHIRLEADTFYSSLKTAYQEAKRYVQACIDQGDFDSFFKGTNSGLNSDTSAMQENPWPEPEILNLITQLRLTLIISLEKEIEEPAKTLANSFLSLIKRKEEDNGPLNIQRIAFFSSEPKVAEIIQKYAEIKDDIRDKALNICLHITMSELFDKQHIQDRNASPVSDFYDLFNKKIDLSAEDLKNARSSAKLVLEAMCKNFAPEDRIDEVAQNIKHRIAYLFLRELNKLVKRQKYDRNHPRAPYLQLTESGDFAYLPKRLYSVLKEIVKDNERVRLELDDVQDQKGQRIYPWIELYRKIESLTNDTSSTIPTIL